MIHPDILHCLIAFRHIEDPCATEDGKRGIQMMKSFGLVLPFLKRELASDGSILETTHYVLSDKGEKLLERCELMGWLESSPKRLERN